MTPRCTTRLHGPQPAHAAASAAAPPSAPLTTDRDAIALCPNDRSVSAMWVAPAADTGRINPNAVSSGADRGCAEGNRERPGDQRDQRGDRACQREGGPEDRVRHRGRDVFGAGEGADQPGGRKNLAKLCKRHRQGEYAERGRAQLPGEQGEDEEGKEVIGAGADDRPQNG